MCSAYEGVFVASASRSGSDADDDDDLSAMHVSGVDIPLEVCLCRRCLGLPLICWCSHNKSSLVNTALMLPVWW